jgi:hypothetical protein
MWVHVCRRVPVIICTDNVFDGYQGAEDMDGEEDEMIEGDMEADMSDMGDMDGKLRHVATRDTLTDICSPPFRKQETVSTSTRKMTTTKVMVTWTTRRVQKSLKKCKRSSQSVFFWKGAQQLLISISYEEVEAFNDARAGIGGSNSAGNLSSWGWSQPVARSALETNNRYRRRPSGHRMLGKWSWKHRNGRWLTCGPR